VRKVLQPGYHQQPAKKFDPMATGFETSQTIPTLIILPTIKLFYYACSQKKLFPKKETCTFVKN
jgi:hypothetical protein